MIRQTPKCTHSGPQKILVVEDDCALRAIMQEFLNMIGYEVHITAQPDHFMNLVDDYGPDLVILDYLLPIQHGGVLCNELKNNPATWHLPVIIYTAYPRAQCRLGEHHCDAFLEKPFDLDDLQDLIKLMLSPVEKS